MFPAIVIQGDSIAAMLSAALALVEKGEALKDDDVYYEALAIAGRLQEHLSDYEDVLEREGFTKTQ